MDFTEVATEVSEIYRRCGSVTGIEDAGRRDMANPGFVYFDCGSWMQGPPSGVMSSTGSVTAALTVGACRRVIVVDWQQGKIGRAMASIECRQHTGELPGSSEVAAMPSGSLHELEAWKGEEVRATCAGSSWSSLRLSWSKGPVGSGEAATSSDDQLKEVPLPFGCFVASRALPSGEAELVLGARSAGGEAGAKVMVWRHDKDGQPVWLSLASLRPADPEDLRE